MIWVLAGTTEARRLIPLLTSRGYRVMASCTTGTGAALARAAGALEVRSGALGEAEMRQLLRERGVRGVIDCTHPFATEASRNAMAACRAEGVPYLRYERPPANLSGAVLAGSFREAAAIASTLGRRVMYTAGVRHLREFLRHCNAEVVVRVLPSSVQEVLDMGVDERLVVGIYPPFTPELERALLRRYGAEVMVMKDSGAEGGTEQKLEVCRELGIRAVVVERPRLEYPEVCTTPEEAVRWVERVLAGRP